MNLSTRPIIDTYLTGLSFGKNIEQMWDDDISETGYFGDAETSSPGSGRGGTDSDDGCERSFWKGKGEIVKFLSYNTNYNSKIILDKL